MTVRVVKYFTMFKVKDLMCNKPAKGLAAGENGSLVARDCNVVGGIAPRLTTCGVLGVIPSPGGGDMHRTGIPAGI